MMSTALSGEIRLGLAMPADMDQIVVSSRALLVEHLAKQTRIARIVLDQQKRLDRFVAHPALRSAAASLTFVSQKSLMLLTRTSNASSCTGLLR